MCGSPNNIRLASSSRRERDVFAFAKINTAMHQMDIYRAGVGHWAGLGWGLVVGWMGGGGGVVLFWVGGMSMACVVVCAVWR